MEAEFVFRVGKWYYESCNCGVQWTTNINEAESFDEIMNIEDLINSEVYAYVKDDITTKIDEVGEPVMIETVIKFYG